MSRSDINPISYVTPLSSCVRGRKGIARHSPCSANHSETLIGKSRLRLQRRELGHKAGIAGWIEDNITDAETGEAGRPACGQGELSSHIAEEPILTLAASMTRLTCCAA
jgi:hypothetical protein